VSPVASSSSRADGVGVVVPTVFTLLLALLSVVPIRIPGYAAVAPIFVLMGVFHWTVYRPELLPPTIIFATGVFLDFLTGAHYPGTSPLVLLIGRAIVLRNRRFFEGQPFPFVWMGFALVAAGTHAALWALGSLLDGTVLDARLAAFRWVLTVAAFPAASYLMVRAQRLLLATG
jgi:rod shape-determining protein MreD